MSLKNAFSTVGSLFQEIPRFVLSAYFTSQSVRLGLFENQGAVWRLLGVGRYDREGNAGPEAIRSFLKDFTLAGVPGFVFSWRENWIEKPVVLPEMPESEIRAAARYTLENHFSLKLNDYLSDWISSCEVVQPQGSKVRQYFVYAVPLKDIERHLEAVREVFERPLAILPSSLAYGCVLSSPGDQRDTGVLEIERGSSTFFIFRKGRPLVSRSIGMGAEDFVDPTGLERLRSALQASIDFYHQQIFAGELGRLYICETESAVPELDRYLETSLELPVTRPASADVQKKIEVWPAAQQAFNKEGASAIPVIGLFLAWREGLVNLLPEDIVFWNKTRARSKFLRLLAIALLAAGAAVNIYAGVSLVFQSRELKAVSSRIVSAQEFAKMYQRVRESQKFRKAMKRGEIPFLAFMKHLGHSVPASCVLAGLFYSKEDGRLEMSGFIERTDTDPVAVTADLVRAISESPFFRKADLTESVRGAEDEYRFRIVAYARELS